MKSMKLFLLFVTATILASACENKAGEIVKTKGSSTLYKNGGDTVLRDSTRLWDKKVNYQYKDCEGNLKTGTVYRPGSWLVKTHKLSLRGDSLRVDSGCIAAVPEPPKKGYRERIADNATGGNGFWPAVGTILAILIGLALIIGAIMLLFHLLVYLWEALRNRRRPDSTHVTQTIVAPATPPGPAPVTEHAPSPIPPAGASVVHHHHYYYGVVNNHYASPEPKTRRKPSDQA